jgi:hypothetical protein
VERIQAALEQRLAKLAGAGSVVVEEAARPEVASSPTRPMSPRSSSGYGLISSKFAGSSPRPERRASGSIS